jgi:SAM-dependent methyltransferase
MYREELEETRKSWNVATEAYNKYQGKSAHFFKEGGNTLFPEERDLLGNIKDLTVAHLLCNSGQDTLSLAQLGAVVTGVDISDEAIASAQKLSQETGIPATFYRADVLDWLEMMIQEKKQFHIVYCSYGAIRWIPDLGFWAREIASLLLPNGRFVSVDFHPVAMMFDRDWNHTYAYCSGGKILTFENGVGNSRATSDDRQRPFTYETSAQDFSNPYHSHTFEWGIGDIITSLANAGLQLSTFKEYLYSRHRHFNGMRETPDQRTLPPLDVPNIPILYGITAVKR